MAYNKRVDKNQKKVVGELRDLGFSVGLTYTVGKGFPDFLVGFYGYNMLVELKSGNGKLTKDEQDFISKYNGYVSIAYSTHDVVSDFLEMTCLLDGLKISFVQYKLGEILKELK